jgi:hypothetical protein
VVFQVPIASAGQTKKTLVADVVPERAVSPMKVVSCIFDSVWGCDLRSSRWKSPKIAEVEYEPLLSISKTFHLDLAFYII